MRWERFEAVRFACMAAHTSRVQNKRALGNVFSPKSQAIFVLEVSILGNLVRRYFNFFFLFTVARLVDSVLDGSLASESGRSSSESGIFSIKICLDASLRLSFNLPNGIQNDEEGISTRFVVPDRTPGSFPVQQKIQNKDTKRLNHP